MRCRLQEYKTYTIPHPALFFHPDGQFSAADLEKSLPVVSDDDLVVVTPGDLAPRLVGVRQSHGHHLLTVLAIGEQQRQSGTGMLFVARTEASVRSADRKLSQKRSAEIRKATPEKNLRWCEYDPHEAKASRRKPVEQD